MTFGWIGWIEVGRKPEEAGDTCPRFSYAVRAPSRMAAVGASSASYVWRLVYAVCPVFIVAGVRNRPVLHRPASLGRGVRQLESEMQKGLEFYTLSLSSAQDRSIIIIVRYINKQEKHAYRLLCAFFLRLKVIITEEIPFNNYDFYHQFMIELK